MINVTTKLGRLNEDQGL